MKLAVIGSRTFNNYHQMKVCIDQLRKKYRISCIISGGANGADKLAERYAAENNIPIEIYQPEWDKFGKSAGFIRNNTIWNNSDFGIAFWDGCSVGTKHSFNIAKKQKKELFIFNFKMIDFYLN